MAAPLSSTRLIHWACAWCGYGLASERVPEDGLCEECRPELPTEPTQEQLFDEERRYFDRFASGGCEDVGYDP
ncbi:MAG TPA: hypothetical protein VMB50_20665 [Myxococcales bacterium]|nr:hypothetical protein [Myxococcales bacterium]